MKVAFKSLIAAAAFIAAGAASATVVTVTAGTTVYKGLKLSGAETLALGQDAKGLFDSFHTSVASYGAGVTTVTQNTDGTYIDVSMSAPITSLSIDDTNNLLITSATKGGLTLTQPALRSVSTGGTLSLSDLTVDLVSKRVYATVVGGNGVGTLTDYYLWNVDTIAGPTSIVAPATGGSVNTLTLSGLHLTADAANTVATSLGYSTSLSKTALASISSFGAITVTLASTPEPVVLTPCTVAFKTTPKTSSLFSTEVTVSNRTSNPATGWNVNWSYGKPTLLINVKNAKLTNKYLQNYTAQPLATNTTIAPNGATTFSFVSNAGGTPPSISNLSATLGGQSCPVTAQ